MRTLLIDILRYVTATRTLIVVAIISVIVTLAGPFGTYDTMGFARRLFYWTLVILASVPFGYGTRTWAQRCWPEAGFFERTFVAMTLMALLYSPVLYLTYRLFHEPDAPLVETLSWFAGLVFCIGWGVNGIRWAVLTALGSPPADGGELPAERSAGEQDGDALAAPRIHQRIADLPCRHVIHVTSRDHYVDIVTREARKTLLLRFSDALSELEGIPGVQVHRSHWVALDAVRGVRRENGRILLDLVNGGEVPVSRSYRARAEAAGLFEQSRAAAQ